MVMGLDAIKDIKLKKVDLSRRPSSGTSHLLGSRICSSIHSSFLVTWPCTHQRSLADRLMEPEEVDPYDMLLQEMRKGVALHKVSTRNIWKDNSQWRKVTSVSIISCLV